jgi:hypothetical protein
MRRMVIGYSARNYQIMDKKSTTGIVILPGMTRLCTRISTGGRVILKGIISLWTTNPPKDGYSARNHPFMDEKSTGGIVFL